jgi:hypothetical protein
MKDVNEHGSGKGCEIDLQCMNLVLHLLQETQRWKVADMVADTPPFSPCICHRICLFLL